MPANDRKARLAAELRANLARRKAQARARQADEALEGPDGALPAAAEMRKEVSEDENEHSAADGFREK